MFICIYITIPALYEIGTRTNDHRESLSSMARRITILSSIMIVTTMMCTVIAATLRHAAGIISTD